MVWLGGILLFAVGITWVVTRQDERIRAVTRRSALVLATVGVICVVAAAALGNFGLAYGGVTLALVGGVVWATLGLLVSRERP